MPHHHPIFPLQSMTPLKFYSGDQHFLRNSTVGKESANEVFPSSKALRVISPLWDCTVGYMLIKAVILCTFSSFISCLFPPVGSKAADVILTKILWGTLGCDWSLSGDLKLSLPDTELRRLTTVPHWVSVMGLRCFSFVDNHPAQIEKHLSSPG